MSIAYALAAYNLARFNTLVIFSILAKIIATVFLLSYYFFFDKIWTVLLSGIGDGLMGIAIFWAFQQYNKYSTKN